MSLGAFQKALQAARNLPEIEKSTSYGTPALKLRKKMLMRMKDDDTYVIVCDREEKDILISAAPEIYFETDHYKGYALVLVRAAMISHDELAHRLSKAWQIQAPKSLKKLHSKAL